MRIFNRVRRFAERHQGHRLLEIAEDNVISPEEEPLYREIVGELLDIEQAIMELRISQEGDSNGAGEKRHHRDNLERILEAFPGREILYQKEIAQWLHMDSRTVKANFPMKGRRCAGGKLLDLRSQSGPRHVVGIKKERLEAGTSKRSVRGLACKSANNSKVILSHFTRKCKPHHGQGGGDSSMMTGWEFIFVLLGVCTATSGLFRAIDKIEGR